MNLVPAKVYFVGSIHPECILVRVRIFSCVKLDEQKARERELAKPMKIDERIQLVK